MNDINKLVEALIKAQAEMSGAKKDKVNSYYKSKYADLGSVFEAVKEPFANNGLCVTQVMEVLESGRTVLSTLLMHNSGQFLKSSMILPDINDAQKLGGAITYFRRYSLLAISGIPAEDDDGNEASSYVKAKKTQAQNKVHELNNCENVGVKRAVELEKRLKEHTEYYMQIQDFLKKNGTCIAQLSQEFGDRIETKLNMLDKVAIEELRAAHG